MRRRTFVALSALVLCAPLDAQRRARLTSGGPLHPQQACFDVAHYELRMTVDPATRSIDGKLTMTAQVTKATKHVFLHLDSVNLKAAAVTANGKKVDFTHEAGKVQIPLGGELAPGQSLQVVVDYGGKPRVAPRPPWDGGFTWAETQAGKPWIATSCQTIGADVWWPCKDHPSDKPDTFDLIISVPNDLYVATNGKLLSDKKGETLRTFHWRVSTPINNYCIALNIAPYVVLERKYKSECGDTFPVFFYALPENEAKAKKAFPHFLDHVRHMEQLCGPYPFRADKYAVVDTPHLGMEHQTIIAYGNAYRVSQDGYDWLHHHEMAHEWWANLVTCRDWKDMWIHEGFGTYMQALYLEKLRGRDAYYRQMRQQFERRPATVAPREVMDTQQIYVGHSIYKKGSWVVHTLRWLMGDEKFFVALRRMAYPDPKLEKTTDGSACRLSDTDEIKAIAEKVHGAKLGWFFEVYLHQPALPRLVTKREGDTLHLEWEVPIDVVFPMPAPIEVNGKLQRVPMPNGKGKLALPENAEVRVDPNLLVLRRTRSRRGR